MFICITERVSTSKHVGWLCACAVRVWLNAHAYLLSKQWRFEYFEAGKYQTLEGFFSQLCTCFAWGATDSDKVSFYLFIHVKIT
jgi:hypothetical protein